MQTHSRHEQRVRAVIKKNGLRVEPVGSTGAVRVVGRDVDVVAASLMDLNPLDLMPYQPIEDERRQH